MHIIIYLEIKIKHSQKKVSRDKNRSDIILEFTESLIMHVKILYNTSKFVRIDGIIS